MQTHVKCHSLRFMARVSSRSFFEVMTFFTAAHSWRNYFYKIVALCLNTGVLYAFSQLTF